MKLYILVQPYRILVMLPPVSTQEIQADSPPIPIQPGGNFLGIPYADLRAKGDGEHEFPEPSTLKL